MSNYVSEQNINKILEGVSKKIPQGIMIGDTYIGHITWQMYLLKDYLKLDGASLANASNDYTDLLKFVQDNSLITSETEDKSLFKYDSATDVLTLPNYIDLVLQGGNTVEEKEAGLPNIEGQVNGVLHHSTGTAASTGALSDTFTDAHGGLVPPNATHHGNIMLDASEFNPIYGNSSTVQPPSALLIPYVKAFAGASADSTDLAITEVANDVARISGRVYLVESAVNDDGSWYRKYSDGWIEQGGFLSHEGDID